MSDASSMPFCAVPVTASVSVDENEERILLGHGAGTRLSRTLMERVFLPAFGNAQLNAGTDSAVLAMPAGQLAFTTDAYVVSPLAFPGGNIGTLAVCGTINDLAMVGAMPQALSVSFILEEGLPLTTLRTVVATMASVAQVAGVPIVTGDTKVVQRGKADGLFITTSGVGRCLWADPVAPSSIEAGDAILVSGDLGRHAVAVLAARQGFVTEPPVLSDVACLHASVAALHRCGVIPHCLRDLTRGGLGAALIELALQRGLACEIDETAISVIPSVSGVVEALGLDPWFLANEGRYVCVVDPSQAALALEAMRQAGDVDAALIGHFVKGQAGAVMARNSYGVSRFVRMPLQEPLPRIC